MAEQCRSSNRVHAKLLLTRFLLLMTINSRGIDFRNGHKTDSTHLIDGLFDGIVISGSAINN